MKIGSKIALFYTLLSVLTTIIIIAVFYLFSTQFINKLYASYLREKAYLTAQKHWEKDEVDEQSYQIIQRKYDELLPEAHEILLNMDSLSEVRDTLNKYLTQHQQALLIAGVCPEDLSRAPCTPRRHRRISGRLRCKCVASSSLPPLSS